MRCFWKQTTPYPALLLKIIFQVYGFIKMNFCFFTVYILFWLFVSLLKGNFEVLDSKAFSC